MLYRLLYLLGIMITLVAAGIAIWPDFEAQNFAPTFESDRRTRLRCPIVIMVDEASQISVTLRNPMTRQARFGVISYLSSGNQTTIPIEEQREIYLEPNESGVLSWPIDRSNAAFDMMVLARVYVYRSGSVPSQAGTCGVWMLNSAWVTRTGLRGQILYLLFIGFGLLSLIIGSTGIGRLKSRRTNLNMGMILTGVVLCALGFGLFGFPMLGIMMILLVIIILASLIERAPESSA